ncbi:MAG TPA: DUF2627 domain-containing protein [Bacillota bacterium]|jgi:TRAP-type C4-dicarboxylate transport system permease small subunit|nr:DUF2627 domain-containing protein [Bacillota bacterium]
MRIIALLVLLIPGILAVFGIKIMRDSLFAEYYPIFFNPGLQFFAGLILFVGGTLFIGGFIVYRDRKNKYKAIPEQPEDTRKDG